MRSEHVEVLVRFELKRTWPMAFRLFGFVAFVHILYLLFDRMSVENVFLAFSAAAFSATLSGGVTMLRDRFEGTLEFTRWFPVSPDSLAVAKLVTAAVVVVPWAVCLAGVMVALSFHLGIKAELFTVFWAVCCIAQLGLMTLASVFLAFASRARLDQGSLAPLIGLAVVVVLSWVVEQLVPNPAAAWQAFVALPASRFMAIGILAAIAIGAIAVSRSVLAGAIDRYVPSRARG
jgi:hypothetical protein